MSLITKILLITLVAVAVVLILGYVSCYLMIAVFRSGRRVVSTPREEAAHGENT